jgi:hypothetical protein
VDNLGKMDVVCGNLLLPLPGPPRTRRSSPAWLRRSHRWVAGPGETSSGGSKGSPPPRAICPGRRALCYSLPRMPSQRSRHTRQIASRTIFFDILLSPMSRSTNMMGISPRRKPFFQARNDISIWKA